MGEPYRGPAATSQIDGDPRYVSEDEATTEAAVVDGPTVEVQAYGEGALGEEIEAEDVKAFETATPPPAPAEEADASTGDESAAPAPVPLPPSAEPALPYSPGVTL